MVNIIKIGIYQIFKISKVIFLVMKTSKIDYIKYL